MIKEEEQKSQFLQRMKKGAEFFQSLHILPNLQREINSNTGDPPCVQHEEKLERLTVGSMQC